MSGETPPPINTDQIDWGLPDQRQPIDPTTLTMVNNPDVLEQEPQAAGLEGASVEAENPYKRFTDEQLANIRDNIADSFVQAIRRYDRVEVVRAGANLAAIQREFQTRFPAIRQQYPRGTEIGDVTYVTEPDPTIVDKIASELEAIDGGYGIVAAMYGGLEMPQDGDKEARLKFYELHSLMSGVTKTIRGHMGTEFDNTVNPYASMTNEELARTVQRFTETIQALNDKNEDTTKYRQNLMLVGQVIQGRKAA